MKKVNEVFFGEHGLTSTSANHLANIAHEKIVSNEAKLKNLNFVTMTVPDGIAAHLRCAVRTREITTEGGWDLRLNGC